MTRYDFDNSRNSGGSVAVHAPDSHRADARMAAVPAAIAAAALGVLMVFGVGFAHSSILHNAAHDTRHAIGFPCH